MLILPGELERWKALVPLRRREWQLPANRAMQATWWRAWAMMDDGWVWRGSTQDREDFDAFVDALFRWHLLGVPMPRMIARLLKGYVPFDSNRRDARYGIECEWHPGIECRGYQFDQYWKLEAIPTEWGQGVPNRDFDVPLDWNNGGGILEFPNANYWIEQEWSFAPGTYLTTATPAPWTVTPGFGGLNTIEAIGPGGSGATGGTSTQKQTGGAGGGYSASTSVPLAAGSPQPFVVGDGGAAISHSPPVPAASLATAGNAGTNDAVFGAATLPSPAAVVGAQKGGGGATATHPTPATPAAGGAAASGKGATKASGGASGAVPTATGASGGGGAGGPHGDGVASAAAAPLSPGGAGDNANPTGGAGSASVQAASPPSSTAQSAAGGTGTGMDASHGSGGGSGGCQDTGQTAPSLGAALSGAGGNYGGGSGAGAHQPSPAAAGVGSGKGGPGLIALTNTAAAGGLLLNAPMTGLGGGGPFFQDRLGRGGAGHTVRTEPRSPMQQAKGRSFTGWPKCLS